MYLVILYVSRYIICIVLCYIYRCMCVSSGFQLYEWDLCLVLVVYYLLSCSFQCPMSLPHFVVGRFVIYDCRFS